jgi:hypothetical protein
VACESGIRGLIGDNNGAIRIESVARNELVLSARRSGNRFLSPASPANEYDARVRNHFSQLVTSDEHLDVPLEILRVFVDFGL